MIMIKRSPIKTIFIHHSTGGDLIKYGHVRQLFNDVDPNIEFWDHGYDLDKIKGYLRLTSRFQSHIYGLYNGSGQLLSKSFQIPNHNTDPDGLAELFNQVVAQPPQNALSQILEFDVVIFKSCFPVTRITNEQQLKAYQTYYFSIRDTIDKYPNKLFISMTPPPLRANLTDSKNAERARQFANWMQSQEYLENRDNLIVFDYFNTLATEPTSKESNVLRPEFRKLVWLDSHPNKLAHQTVAPQWVGFIVKAINKFFATASEQ
jgi:hypothetical protein